MSNTLSERYVGIGPRISTRRSLNKGDIRRKEIAQIVATGKWVRMAYEAANCQPPISKLQGVPGMKVAGHIVASVLGLEDADPRAVATAQDFANTHGAYCIKIDPDDTSGVAINAQ